MSSTEQANKYAANRAALIEDVEWLLAANESTLRIPARLGTNTAALNRRLQRAGRLDLARHFDPKKDR